MMWLRIVGRGSSPLTRGKLQTPKHPAGGSRLIPAHAGKTRSTPAPGKGSRAHPRSRGENEALAASDATDKGSSPLTRGKPMGYVRSLGSGRLIPAHAGKTLPMGSACPPSQAHPRSRGENSSAGAVSSSTQGSSPLTRGKQAWRGCRRRSPRLIPAHAGKTSSRASQSAACAAHPRSRGENVRTYMSESSTTGSSPLTRGKLVMIASVLASVRLIPAHAGKTGHRHGDADPREAHPRSRGENRLRFQGSESFSGSSPLTRGKPRRSASGTRTMGLIPAHAGKTAWSNRGPSTLPAHPRSRGENFECRDEIGDSAGSSPLTRGKRVLVGTRDERLGLIPAHAGKTRRSTPLPTATTAHPRSRGENRLVHWPTRAVMGSSPLTRGKQ